MYAINSKYKEAWLIVLILLSINTLLGQNVITLSDGQFVYRLSVEKVPEIHYRQYAQESPPVQGQKEEHRIGFAVGTVKSIIIFPIKDSMHKQVIIPGKNESSWPWTEQNKGEKFIIEDMNFDGYNDIRLLNSADYFGYYCWVYQPSTRQFMQDTVLNKLIGPQFDQNLKLVYQNWDRVKEHGKGTEIYQYINGVLTLIEEDDIDNNYTNKTTIITIKKRVNGQMKVVSKTDSPLAN